MTTLSCLILLLTEALLKHFNISHSLDQIYPLQFGRPINLWVLLLRTIFKLLSVSWDTFEVLYIMVLHSHLVLIIYLLILMQIRLEIQLNCRFITGIVFFFGNCPITWSAKKQATISRSSTKAEYRALASLIAELCWIHMLLWDLGIFLPHPPLLWCDNVSALAIASNPVFHACTKHIEVDYHFVQERVLKHDLQVKFISFHDQLVDIFTKGLPSPRFHWLTSNSCGNSPFVWRGMKA